ncbi:MAG: TIGR04211 family SH3 domain-containing protein [Deltaproteobacteria bacterium]|nr:TIGR04211 family SH3 domain-containing protein [Deltaproteobacteria bacterium]
MALSVLIVILGTLFLCPSHLWAKTMYITDRIELSLRSGTGLEYRTLTMVKTGDRVEVLESDKNWSKVKLANGTVGWVNTFFLVDQIKAAVPSDSKIQDELRGLKEANQNLVREKEILIQEKNSLLKEVEEAKNQTHPQEKNGRISHELTALKLKNEQLDKEVALYKKQIEQFSQKETGGGTEEKVKWFLIGSVVLVMGLLLGWLMSRSRRKPHRYY